MTIQRSRDADAFSVVLALIAFVFVLLALYNVFTGVALVASSLWLAFVTLQIWWTYQEDGGFRQFLINRLGGLSGQQIVEVDLANVQPRSLHFGFELHGRCFIQRTIPLDGVQSVKWSTGQATDLAGRDMNDWHVWLRFNRDEPAKTEKRRTPRKRDLDLYGIGSPAHKDKTEALGLSVVAFLRDAGIDLIPRKNLTRYVRRSDVGEAVSVEQDA